MVNMTMRYVNARDIKLAEDLAQISYICKCGHTVKIKNNEDYAICRNCGAKVDRTFKKLADKQLESRIQNYFFKKKEGIIK